jgi:coenzyme F420-reducing hydrogenase alpha subunit
MRARSGLAGPVCATRTGGRRILSCFGNAAHSAFLYRYARLIEVTYALERVEMLLDDPRISL